MRSAVRHETLQPNTQELTRYLAQLEHHGHRRLLPGRLVQRDGGLVVLTEQLQGHPDRTRAGDYRQG